MTMVSSETPAPPRILLAHHLQQLKLPTVLREYEKTAVEASREGHDHVRYLLRLVELELIDREQRLVERRIRRALSRGQELRHVRLHRHPLAQQAADAGACSL